MKKRHFLARTLLASLLYFPLSTEVQAQSSCSSCEQTLNTSAQEISTNTAGTNSLLQQLLTTVTQALFGTLYDFGNTESVFLQIPAIQSNSYEYQMSLLKTVEAMYQGNAEKDSSSATLAKNYSEIFNNYLLENGGTFDPKIASIASLYRSPSSALPTDTYLNDDQKLTAQRYIVLASGAAMSTMQKPSNDWLTINPKDPDQDRLKIREKVSAYYTYSAIQSAIADNFSYVYGLNTGQPFPGSLKGYSDSMMSESGVFTYIQSQKVENEDWYDSLKAMAVADLLREQTILIGGSFLMLSRIEEDLRRILITNSAQASLTLIGTQMLTQAASSIPKTSAAPIAPPTF